MKGTVMYRVRTSSIKKEVEQISTTFIFLISLIKAKTKDRKFGFMSKNAHTEIIQMYTAKHRIKKEIKTIKQ